MGLGGACNSLLMNALLATLAFATIASRLRLHLTKMEKEASGYLELD